MQYPIIVPEFYQEIVTTDKANHPDVFYNVLMTPAAVEYAFPLNQETVIRKLMEKKEPLQYKMVKLKPEEEKAYSEKAQDIIDEYPVLRNYWDIKGLTMNVLQDRRYPIEHRMLMLNFIYKNVQIMLDKSKDEAIPQFVAAFANQPDHEDVIKYFKDIKPNPAYSLSDGLSLLASLPVDEELAEIKKDVCRALGIPEDMKKFAYDEAKYMGLKMEFSKDFLKGREHYMENVIVNYVWTYCMPYADYNLPIWKNFIFFNTIFNTLKVLLTCYTSGKEDKDEAFVKAVRVFDNALRSCKVNIVAKISQVNEDAGLSNNGDMAVLSIS